MTSPQRKRPIAWIIVPALLLIFALILPAAAQEGGPPSNIGLELVADGFAAPVDMDQPNDNSGRMFVVDQVGIIYIIDAEGNRMEQPFLNIQDRMVELNEGYSERGLLGLAFHPDFANNGRFFVYYSAPLREEAPDDWDHTSHLSAFQVSADNENVADPGSEEVLMRIDQPQSNHNAGDIQFGPDGYLYVPLGDGGNADDQGIGHTDDIGNAQDMTKLLGKILRIDVDGGTPYAVPEDNPFVGDDNTPDEIWASGFRNPWRISHDDQLGWFVADLGQNVWEEVHMVSAGDNAGWRLMEGSHCFHPEYPDHNPLNCEARGAADDNIIAPIIEYNHQVGIAIIGGHVYRGSNLSSNFEGTYLFGDWSTSFGQADGHLFVAAPPPNDAPDAMWKMHTLQVANTESGNLEEFLLAFAEDQSNELYILTSETPGPTGDTGKVYRLVSAESVG